MNGDKFICITGPDGSGKSTMVSRIVKALEAGLDKKIALVTIWDQLTEPETRDKVGFKSPGEFNDFFPILHPTARTLFLYYCMFQALAMAEKKAPDIYLIDSYWYKYYSTEIAHGADPDAIGHLSDIFPEPSLTFYLEVDPDETCRRKDSFSGYECGFAPADKQQESFRKFQTDAYKAFSSLKKGKNWIEIDGKDTIENNEKKIMEIIMKRFQGS